MSENVYRGKPMAGEGAPSWWLGNAVRNTIGRVLLWVYRVRFLGTENLPEGGVIVAGNHVSYLDPALMWCGSPRKLHFVAKEELWQVGWLGFLLDRFWAFPVKRGAADREMISTATRLLGVGEPIAMFPEGTRAAGGDSDELGEAQGGVSFIALRAGVPIVPVGIAGTDKALPKGAKLPRFPRVTVVFGEPVHPDDFEGGRKERMAALTDELMKRIREARDVARGA